jgi:deoxyribose-phosphate aldolase
MSKPELTAAQMAKYIDHTILKPDANTLAIDRLCAEADEHGFAAVCVNSCHVARAAELLEGSGVKVCSVVGFPLGAMHTKAKAYEASQAVADGADEIDMVLNVGLLKSGDLETSQADIEAVKRACGDAHLKVIIETCLLSDEEKVKACEIAKAAGADFVKTSTGFAGGGATVGDIALMRKTVGPDMGVKASGGVGDWDDAIAMIQAGATRIGASAGIAILGGSPK